jgi:hypothetical protein
MLNLIAYADNTDYSPANLAAVMKWAGAMLGVALLAGAVVVIARRRSHTGFEKVATVAVFWAIVTGGTVIHTLMQQADWAREQSTVLREGYLSPEGSGPGWPWGMLAGLGVGYAGLVVWAVAGRRGSRGA